MPSGIFEILTKSGQLEKFIHNPQLFIENTTQIIRDNRHALAIDGIRYEKMAGQEYYILDVIDSTELLANLGKNAVAVNNSVYDYIIYDSNTIDKSFAKVLDGDKDIKMFFKLPERFKIETPIGTYNPDWAVYLETKSRTNLFDLPTGEQLKLHCGKRHFEALEHVSLQVAKA